MRIRSRSSIRRFARMFDSSDKNHAEEDETPRRSISMKTGHRAEIKNCTELMLGLFNDLRRWRVSYPTHQQVKTDTHDAAILATQGCAYKPELHRQITIGTGNRYGFVPLQRLRSPVSELVHHLDIAGDVEAGAAIAGCISDSHRLAVEDRFDTGFLHALLPRQADLSNDAARIVRRN
jgi:hypothetical protein